MPVGPPRQTKEGAKKKKQQNELRKIEDNNSDRGKRVESFHERIGYISTGMRWVLYDAL